MAGRRSEPRALSLASTGSGGRCLRGPARLLTTSNWRLKSCNIRQKAQGRDGHTESVLEACMVLVASGCPRSCPRVTARRLLLLAPAGRVLSGAPYFPHPGRLHSSLLDYWLSTPFPVHCTSMRMKGTQRRGHQRQDLRDAGRAMTVVPKPSAFSGQRMLFVEGCLIVKAGVARSPTVSCRGVHPWGARPCTLTGASGLAPVRRATAEQLQRQVRSAARRHGVRVKEAPQSRPARPSPQAIWRI